MSEDDQGVSSVEDVYKGFVDFIGSKRDVSDDEESEESEEEDFGNVLHIGDLNDGFQYFMQQSESGRTFNPCKANIDALDIARKERDITAPTNRKWDSRDRSKLMRVVGKYSGKVDWAEVQSTYFPNRSATSCRATYENHVSKSEVNFTAKESQVLAGLAKQHGERDWFEIAEQLVMKTNRKRSAWTCLEHYVKKLRPSTVWTGQDDARLVMLVDKFGDESWSLVSELMMNGCSSQQCAVRYRRSVKLSLGPKNKVSWSHEEDNRLKRCIKAYPDLDWRLIKRHFSGKTDLQCRERWSNKLNPELRGGETSSSAPGWSEAEDRLLLETVSKVGKGNWAAIARSVNAQSPGKHIRTDQMIKRRYIKLSNKLARVENSCTYVFPRGENAGKRCTRKRAQDLVFCKKHATARQSKRVDGGV
mmetsp:Transcript_4728/g.8442  ORF Transcript_4728/g.8442 Transcript_4728/m.8442 type:complete len:418 (-) Transcript_4728:1878-3131(-)